MANNEQSDVKSKTWKLFTAAVIFALLAGVGTMIYLKVLEHRLKARLTPAEKEMIHVVVASGDLPAGSVINNTTMAVRAVPREYVNSDILTPDQFNSIQGAILIKDLEHGKMLSQEYIDLKIPKDFSGTIQVGHRAITIQVDEMNSIAGMIRPGNTIDLFTRISAGSIPGLSSSGEGEVVIPVLEDVLVLATDKISARPNEDEFNNLDSRDRQRVYNSLTLEVTPREAGLIAIAESRGNLIAALRNSNDTGGILFTKVGLADLVAHSGEMLEDAVSKQHNRDIDGIHVNQDGQLVTRDGVVVTDPNVHLNQDGLLVTKDGTILSGRDLTVGKDGRIRTRDGKLVDTASLIPGKDGTLVDKDGTVLAGNGYTTAQGGFLVDKNGNVITHDGNVLTGVTVGKDGKVRTTDGRVLTADQISVGKDGKVRIAGDTTPAMRVDQDGNLRTSDGKLVEAKDLVSVGADGVVRTKDGKVLPGVTVGKDGELYTADGKKMSAADVMIAQAGFKQNQDGTVTDANGKVYAAKDLVTVDGDGTVRTRDGTVLHGVHVDKDGNLRDEDGNLLTAADIVKQSAIAQAQDKAADALMVDQGFTANSDGTVVDKNGKVYTAKDLVTVGSDGKVRTRDGTVLDGAYVDGDGKLRNKDGSLLSARDVFRQKAIATAASGSEGEVLPGVTGHHDPGFAQTIGRDAPEAITQYVPYEVEYIIGGASDGAAKTFKVQIENNSSHGFQLKP